MNEKIIMYESPEAATYVTNIEGWIDINRRFFGKGEDGERMARYSSHTHKLCECGGIAKKGWTKCDDCISKLNRERYLALPFREWDGIEPVCLPDGGRYFFTEDDLIDYMVEDEEEPMTEIDLLICTPNHWIPVREDYWEDNTPEDSDGELPTALKAALDNLNNVAKSLPPQSYSPGKIRTTYTLKPDHE